MKVNLKHYLFKYHFFPLLFFLKVKMLVAQLCLTLCDTHGVSMICPDSSAHGILQARIPEWVAILFSRASFQPRHRALVSYIAARFFTVWATQVVSYSRPFHFSLKSYIFNVLSYIFHPFFFMILHFGVSSELSSSLLYFSSAVCYREFLIIFLIIFFFALTHI